MNLLDGIKKNNTSVSINGSKYYDTSYNSNLDVFTMITRFNYEPNVINLFNNALIENEELALANLLYILDIREGKGERRLFKIIYKFLCNEYTNQALRILPFISELGRYDYLLVGINTKIEKETIEAIKNQLNNDKTSDTPSLLAKWLPSIRTHKKNNLLAKKLVKLLNISEKEYRKLLAQLRSKLNIIEKNLTNKEYDKIEFDKIPAKALLKYNQAYVKNIKERYSKYKDDVKNKKSNINTSGLFSYEIVKKILSEKDYDNEIYDLMWKNQKEILENNSENLIVVADTSESMFQYDCIPYCTSIGLAIYISERNKGFFKNNFISFSRKPILQQIKGNTLVEKIQNIETINATTTDIDKVFELILTISKENKLKQSDLPTKILIITDMDFNKGVYSKNSTNFEGWKQAFKENGYKLPTIIFWNAGCETKGVPVTNLDDNVIIVSGFSTNILNNLLTIEKYTPEYAMLDKLSKYLKMLN